MFYVLAFPEFEPPVGESINQFRSAYEPERAKLVPPHVTLVFGLRDVNSLELLSHCESVAMGISEFTVEFLAGEVVYDPYEKKHKIFLYCSSGDHELISLHEQLYDGLPHAEFHSDSPFRPHMTVATHSKRAALELLDVGAMGPFPVCGQIKKLQVVELVDNTLNTLRTIPLRR